MNMTIDFAPAAAELFLLSAASVVLLADLFVPPGRRQITWWLSLATLVGAALTIVLLVPEGRSETFGGAFVSDAAGNLLKLLTCGIVLLAFIYSRDYLRERGLFHGEFYVLGLFATLGVFVMASAASMLILYLGLELLSLSLYAKVAYNRDSPISAEAAMK
jgi:NADH-quinone oxidoreductase subunit N